MKVRELIAALQAMPQDAIVVVDGFEGGATIPEPPNIVSIYARNTDGADWYWGEYDFAHTAGRTDAINAVLLARTRG